MADTKKTATAKKPVPKKKPAAKRPPVVTTTPEIVQSARSAVRLAHEQVQYFERRLRSAKGHDTLSLRKILVDEATEGLAAARATYNHLSDEYMDLKEKLHAGK
jgi:hypothetical protein